MYIHDSMGGGAWPFLVGDANCLVYSVNERDFVLPLRKNNILFFLLRGTTHENVRRIEVITGL